MADKKISALTAATLPLAGTEVLPIVQGGVTVKVATDDLTVKNFRSNATTGILQVAGPAVGTTRTMTTPNANFTVARTDAAQTFTGNQSVEGILITRSGNALRFNNPTNGNWSQISNTSGGEMRLASGSGDVLLLNGADASILAGNLIVSTAGKGIDFSANTHAAGMTSELLNDYEEGTFTPVLSSSGTPPTVTSYLAQYGSYTKIGNRVLVTVQIRATISAVGTGYPVVTGLPYAANASCLNGPAWGLAPLINIGIAGNYVSGTTVQMAYSSYNATTDYLSFSIMYEI